MFMSNSIHDKWHNLSELRVVFLHQHQFMYFHKHTDMLTRTNTQTCTNTHTHVTDLMIYRPDILNKSFKHWFCQKNGDSEDKDLSTSPAAPPIPEYTGPESKHQPLKPLAYITKDLDRWVTLLIKQGTFICLRSYEFIHFTFLLPRHYCSELFCKTHLLQPPVEDRIYAVCLLK